MEKSEVEGTSFMQQSFAHPNRRSSRNAKKSSGPYLTSLRQETQEADYDPVG